MAGNPECMVGDGVPSVFIGTFLENGQSITVCPEHFVGFLETTLASMTGAAIEDIAEAASDDDKEPWEFPEMDNLEPEFQEWITEQRDNLEAEIKSGATFEQAVQRVLDRATEPDSTNNDSLETTN